MEKRELSLKQVLIIGAIAIVSLICLGLWLFGPSLSRNVATYEAEATGGDWVIVQLDMNGRAFRCWRLERTSVVNEEHSDGIYWLDPHGNLVHISGMYNRVQVVGDNWEHAYRELGLTQDLCEHIHDHQESSER